MRIKVAPATGAVRLFQTTEGLSRPPPNKVKKRPHKGLDARGGGTHERLSGRRRMMTVPTAKQLAAVSTVMLDRDIGGVARPWVRHSTLVNGVWMTPVLAHRAMSVSARVHLRACQEKGMNFLFLLDGGRFSGAPLLSLPIAPVPFQLLCRRAARKKRAVANFLVARPFLFLDIVAACIKRKDRDQMRTQGRW